MRSLPSKQACREWLASMPQSLVSAPDFCPNAEILFDLRVNQPGHAVVPNNLAHIADLERFEDEIDDLLLQKPNDDPMMADLQRPQGASEGRDRMASPQSPAQKDLRIDTQS